MDHLANLLMVIARLLMCSMVAPLSIVLRLLKTPNTVDLPNMDMGHLRILNTVPHNTPILSMATFRLKALHNTSTALLNLHMATHHLRVRPNMQMDPLKGTLNMPMDLLKASLNMSTDHLRIKPPMVMCHLARTLDMSVHVAHTATAPVIMALATTLRMTTLKASNQYQIMHSKMDRNLRSRPNLKTLHLSLSRWRGKAVILEQQVRL
jgi:hypothetical protein